MTKAWPSKLAHTPWNLPVSRWYSLAWISNSVCVLEPLAMVTTGMPAACVAASWASSSVGLVVHRMMASGWAWISDSIWDADSGMEPRELSRVVDQPLARAAASAELAARAWVSEDI